MFALQTRRKHEVSELVRMYSDLGSILLKIESIIFMTNSGCSSQMHRYYRYWELRIYHAIVNMVVSNLNKFSKTIRENNPWFEVEVHLVSPDVVLEPNFSEVINAGLMLVFWNSALLS